MLLTPPVFIVVSSLRGYEFVPNYPKITARVLKCAEELVHGIYKK